MQCFVRLPFSIAETLLIGNVHLSPSIAASSCNKGIRLMCQISANVSHYCGNLKFTAMSELLETWNALDNETTVHPKCSVSSFWVFGKCSVSSFLGVQKVFSLLILGWINSEQKQVLCQLYLHFFLSANVSFNCWYCYYYYYYYGALL